MDVEQHLVDLPHVELTAGIGHQDHVLAVPQGLEQARHLAGLFVSTMLFLGAKWTEPLAEHKAKFAYFRAHDIQQDWFC